MTRNKQTFVDWLKQKLTFSSKKRYAGATKEQDYFRYETFNFLQLKEKLSENDDLDNCIVNLNNNETTHPKPSEPMSKVVCDGDIKSVCSVDQNDVLQTIKTVHTISSAYKLRTTKKNSKKKESKANRMTVIPTLASSPNEKIKTSTEENALKKSGHRFRFSLVGSLRRKLRRDSTYNNEIGSLEHLENGKLRNERSGSLLIQNCRSKRILSDPLLENIPSKLSEKERQTDSGFEESLNKIFDNICEKTISSVTSDFSDAYEVEANASQEDSIDCCDTNQDKNKEHRNKFIAPTTVPKHLSSLPFSEITPSKFLNVKTSFVGNISEYVTFNAQSEFSETFPRSPTQRKSDPYVNLQFNGIGIHRGSQQSLHEDNYCLGFGEWTPEVPPRTYKKYYSTPGFVRGCRSYQSCSSFSTRAINNYDINNTLQRLPKSVAAKCETFCRRIDSMPLDYLPMDMHPSSKLSIH